MLLGLLCVALVAVVGVGGLGCPAALALAGVLAAMLRLDRKEEARLTARASRQLERVGLAEHAKVRLDKLSGGQQQKVQLGVTIMNTPSILILDEPTASLDDVAAADAIKLLLQTAQAQGATLVIATHDARVEAAAQVQAAAWNRSASPLLQYRLPVGRGPSPKTCPWWPPQRAQWYSVRGKISLKSVEVPRAPAIGCQKLGQPVPLSNFVSELKSSWLQQIQ